MFGMYFKRQNFTCIAFYTLLKNLRKLSMEGLDFMKTTPQKSWVSWKHFVWSILFGQISAKNLDFISKGNWFIGSRPGHLRKSFMWHLTSTLIDLKTNIPRRHWETPPGETSKSFQSFHIPQLIPLVVQTLKKRKIFRT